MATCPRCLGPLTEHHRCPSSRFRRFKDALLWPLGGGAAGALAPLLADERPSAALVLAAAALGAVLAKAVREAIVPRV